MFCTKCAQELSDEANFCSQCGHALEPRVDLESWASVFRFHPLAIEDIYNTPVFEEAVWYQPSSSVPLSLFET